MEFEITFIVAYFIIGILIVYGAYYVKKKKLEYQGKKIKISALGYFKMVLILLFYPILVLKYIYEKILDYLVFD